MCPLIYRTDASNPGDYLAHTADFASIDASTIHAIAVEQPHFTWVRTCAVPATTPVMPLCTLPRIDNIHSLPPAGHSKAVSCLDVDHTGSRLLSGSRDNSLRIFDFNGMKSTMRSFRSLEPSEGHPMLATSWSPTGERVFPFSTANIAHY